MRRQTLPILTLTVLLLNAGCGSSEKSPDHSLIQPPSPVIKSTHNAQSGDAPAETTEKNPALKVECAVKGDARILEVQAKNEGCELRYTKAGKVGVVASSLTGGTEYCQKSLEKMQTRLTGSGFECK